MRFVILTLAMICLVFGCDGSPGDMGDMGIQGPQGDKGDKGDKGDQGERGTKGEQGDAGPAGPQGPQGNQGISGPAGAAGLHCWDTNENGNCDTATEDVDTDGVCSALDCTGPQGPQGVQGQQGVAGAQGDQGMQGEIGPEGPAGPPGPGAVLRDSASAPLAWLTVVDPDSPRWIGYISEVDLFIKLRPVALPPWPYAGASVETRTLGFENFDCSGTAMYIQDKNERYAYVTRYDPLRLTAPIAGGVDQINSVL